MIYVENEIPNDLAPYKVGEVARLREQFKTEAFVLRGVLRWKSNQAPVPLDIFRDACCTAPTAQADALDDYTSKTIDAYFKSRASQSDEDRAEEMLEARAAHGPGVALVNCITGHRFST